MKNLFSTSAVPSFLAATAVVISSSVFSPANAASFTYNLDCVISGTVGTKKYDGGSTCAKVDTSFGTLTIKDNATDAKKVDVVIDLAGTNKHKIQTFDLNYKDDKFDNKSLFEISAASPYAVAKKNAITVDEDKQKASGYKGKLDLEINPSSTGASNDGFTATISAKNFDLNAADFNFQDTLNQIFAAVHIGNYGVKPGESGNNSIWVGASSYYQAPPKPKYVPEPRTTVALALFALGALGLLKKTNSLHKS
ncbi:hypothetical protein [Nostoc sp. CHAB 5715]|uniref:hypothetical protein n=1 Tax=Nostoc sp. CHAB 5715 TaxID=2780400 RepID=UPI001E393B39|nr:hypothetical protein [Nostoc sp. CHAB 5715]MCC5621241.1 hypothetical protein [Nostoc sp. CHAB 5715]